MLMDHCRRALLNAVLFMAGMAFLAAPVRGDQQPFQIGSRSILLEDVSTDTAVYYTSMRLNRAQNAWNVEVTVSNKSDRVLSGPLVLLVDGFSGTSGPLQTDGAVLNGKQFIDLSAKLGNSSFAPSRTTAPRTLALGMGNGSPSLAVKVYAGIPPAVAALAVTRSLDEAGRPLPAVKMRISGPAGASVKGTDPDSGVSSFGQSPGTYIIQFSLEGYLPVWRRQTLASNQPAVMPNPRLTKRSAAVFNLTPLGETIASNVTGTILVTLPAGAVSQNSTLTLTPLDGQSLPAFLPLGWSPLSSFWVEASSPIQNPLQASLLPLAPIDASETAALARWDESAFRWMVVQTFKGNGTNFANVVLPGDGAYALVVGDAGEFAPPSPQIGQELMGGIAGEIASTNLTAAGSVTPPSSPASVVPELVTGTANLVLTHSSQKLPSGYLLRGEVTETYLLSDGSLRLTPQYEHFIVGYQRPGDQNLFTLHASFPMRPLMLFGPEQLDSATVRVDVLPQAPFDGQVLDENGGQIATDGVRLLAGDGNLTSPSALRLRRLDSTVFTNLIGDAGQVLAAFDLVVDRSTLGGALAPQIAGAPPGKLFVLARVLSDTGFYGLQPVERLRSDAQGNLQSLEPAPAGGLPGLRGSGQFVLILVDQPQGLISGVARNGQGALQARMPVRLSGLPWLALTDGEGRFQLVAPAGTRDLGATDPLTGDTGFVTINLTDPTPGLTRDVAAAPSGPRVARITPAHNAQRVPRVGSVVIEFNEAVNPATLAGGIQLLRTNDSVVPAALTLNLRNTIATLSPATELDPNTLYRVRLAATIADPGGLPLEGRSEFEFTTMPLSTRDPAAQLIIYEPGASGVPPEVLAQIPAYEPGEDPFAIVVRGTPGTADPEVAVVLVNETTAETATVLSKPDGSFASVISGTEADFVSATFVNLNGTRVYVPVSRQLFDNGFVGLYPQGGILEAQSDGGPVQVLIQPNSIPSRTKFRLKTLSLSQLMEATGGVTPELATIAGGGMKIQVEGQSPTEPMKVSFPVDLSKLGYPTNQEPAAAAAALARVRNDGAVTTFEVLDQLVFQPGPAASPRFAVKSGARKLGFGDTSIGTFNSLLGFVPSIGIGLVAPLLIEHVIMPILLGANPVLVKGVTQHLPETDGGIVDAMVEAFNAELIVNPVQGAFVALRTVANPVNGAGRLQPGMVHATSGADGKYLMVAPGATPGYIITATHPAFSDTPSADINPYNDVGFAGAVFDRLIFHTPNTENAPLRLNISHAPYYPAPNQDCEVQISAFRGAGASPEILVRVLSVTNITGGDPATLSDVTLTNINISNSGVTRLWKGTLVASKAVQVVLKIVADGKISNYPINFNGIIPPVAPSAIPKPDTNDLTGPLVVSTFPPEGGYASLSGEITFLFNKPIDRYVEEAPNSVTLDGPFSKAQPVLRLSPGQQSLIVQYSGLPPDQEYTVTLSSQAVRDLAGRPMDQRPSTPEPDSFRLRFKTSPVRTAPLPLLANGRGATIRGRYLYALDASPQGNSLLTYDLKDPSAPLRVQTTKLFGQPRDMVLIPQYGYRLTPHSAPVTNDLMVVVGGDLDTIIDSLGDVTVKGQYLTVFDLANPEVPHQLASPIVTYRVSSAVTKVQWSAPNLIYQEYGQDIQQLGAVNLQEVIIGFNLPTVSGEFRAGREGADLNNDGDYVDEDEVVPIPQFPPTEFYGKKFAYVLSGTTQKILDFSAIAAGQLVGITLTRGEGRDITGHDNAIRFRPSYRTLALNLNTAEPIDSLYQFDAAAYPRWVSVFPSLHIVTNGVSFQPVAALVSLQPDADEKQVLAVIDITFPSTPRLINKIPISADLLGGPMQSVRQREDGLLELAGGQNIVLLDSRYFGAPEPLSGRAHPAIVGFIPAAGAGSRTFATSEFGLHAIADAARGTLIQTPPVMEFVNFPASTEVVNPSQLAKKGEAALHELSQTMRSAFAIPPARANDEPKLGILSDLKPPKPASHYHVHVRAPGTSGASIELGLESVNHAGRPLANLGNGYAPVRAISVAAQESIGQKPRAECGAPIRSLTAWRMSDVPTSPFFNQYLSRPFALVANETLSAGDIAALQAMVDREILYSGAGLRAFIDPSQSDNKVIGPFAATVNASRKLLQPISTASAITLFHPYIMGDNPPPSGGYVALPATYGMVAAHSGELRTEAADMDLPSPRMPISIQRAIGNQDTYEGPFGVGWDFNYNQRITELDPVSFPLGLQMPLIVRATKADSEIAGSQDVLFNTGMGKTLRFRWVSTNMPPEYKDDPLVIDFDYQTRVSDYFLPAKGQGIFDLLVKNKDGRFERLTPDGARYRYAANGRLETIIDRFPANRHELEYDRNGWLVRIDDKSVKSSRYVELGHYRSAEDPDFREGLDERTSNSQLEGKISKLRNYAGGDVLFVYDDDGFLIRRDGLRMDGENGGFKGRAQTHYTYRNCRFAGIKVTAKGAPLFTADTMENSKGKPVVKAGAGIGGSVGVNVPAGNSAATLENQASSANLADSSTTELQFDKLGHPKAVTSSGAAGAPAVTLPVYDDDGLIKSIVHPEGNSETMEYDSANSIFRSRGNLLRRTVNPGLRGGEAFTEEFRYDSRYNLNSGIQKNANGFGIVYRLRTDARERESIDYGSAGTDEFVFNDNGQMTSSLDFRGVRKGAEYDPVDGFVQTETAGDNHYDYVYDGSYASRMGMPSRIVMPVGAPVERTYDNALQVTATRRGDVSEINAYDEQRRPQLRQITLDDGKSQTTKLVYDEKGFMTSSTTEGVETGGGAASIRYEYTPDALSRIKSIKLPQGTIQSQEYDNRGNLIKRTFGEHMEEYGVDLHGNVTSVKEGGELVKSITYDGFDRPTQFFYPTRNGGETETRTYYPGGQVRVRTLTSGEFGVAGETSRLEIDEIGRPRRVVLLGDTLSPEYTYVYQPLTLTEIGPRMTVKSMWNEAGHAVGYTDAITSEQLFPDANGNVEQIMREEDGAVFHEFYTFDSLENPKTYRDDLGQIASYVVRGDKRYRTITNGRGKVTTYDHTSMGEPLSRLRADGMKFQYQYNSLRQSTYVGDSRAGFVQGYDASLRLASKTLRDGSVAINSDFDPREMPRQVTFPGGGASFSYDLKRRMLERHVAYQGTTYDDTRAYDALDRPRRIQYRQDDGPENAVAYHYDSAGPLLSVTRQEEGADITVGYEYYADLTRKTVKYPSGSVVTEFRDSSGRLTGVGDQNGTIIRATSWHGNHQPKSIELGPINIDNQYDARGRLTASRAAKAADGTVLTHMRYRYDAANNLEIRQFLHRGGRADGFSYDDGERVSAAKVGALPASPATVATPLYQRDYSYNTDGLDYLTSVASTNLGLSPPPFASTWSDHDAFLLPGAVDGFNRAPADPKGNVQFAILPVRPPGSAAPAPRSVSLVHNGNGNLIRILREDGVVEENFFQPDGMRYRRRVTNGPEVLDHRHFVYDSAGRLLEEYDITTDAPFLIARYFYAASDAPEAADLYNYGSGQTNRYYFLKDNVESVIAVVDESGTVVERAWYDTFGQPSLEQRDTESPALKSVVAGEGGSLLIALSESVLSPLADPGAGTGILPIPPPTGEGVIDVSINSTNIPGTSELLPSFEGYAPFSVLRFTPSGGLPATPSSVLGWWPADAGVTDAAGGNAGAFRGGAKLGAGIIQQSFSLNGTSAYVEITNAGALNLGTGDFTVSTWVDFNGTSGEQVIAEKWAQASRSGWSLVKRADQRLLLTVGDGAGGEFNIETAAPPGLPANTWIQIAIRRQGNQFTVLTNGVSVATGSAAVNVNSSATLKFGSREGTSAFLNGRIDEVAIHSRALSDHEIVSIAGGVSVPGPVTVRLNAGTLADEWGNQNEANEVSFMLAAAPGLVFYSAQPDPDTAAPRIARSSVGSPFLFHGQYFDYDTGLVYLRARFYDPFAGMFLEPDPLGYEDSVNLYAGMGNNPVAFRDPTGLSGENAFLRLVQRAFKPAAILAERAKQSVPFLRNRGLSTLTAEGIANAKKLKPLEEAAADLLNPKYKGMKMLTQFVEGDKKGGVTYLNEVQRKAYEVTVKDGLLYDAAGKLLDTREGYSSVLKKGVGIFVMDEFGRLYVAPTQVVGKFHHSSFVAGGKVATAGEIVVDRGRILVVTTESGHYRPSEYSLRTFYSEMQERGVDISLMLVPKGGRFTDKNPIPFTIKQLFEWKD